MKKILISLMTLAAILATSTVWAQSAPSYDLNAVAGQATAALSRVGVVEHDLAVANERVAQLDTDLDTLRHSRSAAGPGAIRRANQALAAAQATVAKLEKESAVAQATNAAAQKRLETLMAGKATDFGMLLPTEDPIVGLVRQECPQGTVPEYIEFGTNRRFDCRPLLKASDLTVPVASQPTSKYIKCLVWGAVGGATGGGGSYAIARAADRDYGFWDAAGASGLGVAAGYGICLLASD